MSVEKSYFFDQIGAILTTLWTAFEPCGSNHCGEEGRNSRHPAVRSILRPAKIAVSMIRIESSRSEQVRFIAGIPIVLAPKVLTRQQRRTRVCSLQAGKNSKAGKAADLQNRVRATDGLQQKRILKIRSKPKCV